jgi:alkanesulfonate monooxygenase SsuD/methylene tetrahydromethanopterin reductase-like flavin-dependent oxidoreductase (luciferase family)
MQVQVAPGHRVAGGFSSRRPGNATIARCGRRSRPPPARTGNSTALVGAPETAAQALLDYVDIGESTILIRGYDPYDNGRHLLPLVRAEVARCDQSAMQPVTRCL